jgi:hypothetical protein
VNVRIEPVVSATNRDVLRDLAVTGAGIILQPAFIVRRDLAQGTLIPVLPEWKALESSLFAVYLSHRQLSDWLPVAAFQWALCGAGLSATIVLIECWSTDPDGIAQAALRASVASATSLLGVLLGA